MLLSSRSAVAARPPPNRYRSVEPAGRNTSVGSPVERRHNRMKRVFLFAAAALAALAFALPATAGTTVFRGVVIAKKAGRHAFVTASKNGVVRTVRARGALKRIGVGRRVAVRAAALPDGTFAANSVKLLGKSRRTHFRATVVAKRGLRLFLSAGGSVFALRVKSGHKT